MNGWRRDRMAHMRSSRIVVSNWKMNPETPTEAARIVSSIAKQVPRGLLAIVLPPSLFLSDSKSAYRGSKVHWGVQNIHFEKNGAFTGEVSAPMARGSGAEYVLIGHSERRALGESNEVVRRKIQAAMGAGLSVILCIGEPERTEHGEHFDFLKEELHHALEGLAPRVLARLIVAYEPIWAIGKRAEDAMTPHDVHETSLFIRRELHHLFGKKGFSVPVLYGGSVAPENAGELVARGEVNGLLVGRESLIPARFGEIMQAVARA